MSASPTRLTRLLALVPYLLARPQSRLSEVAATFNVSVEQLRQDLELIWMCGLPGYYPGDLIDVDIEGDTVTLSNADASRARCGCRPMRLLRWSSVCRPSRRCPVRSRTRSRAPWPKLSQLPATRQPQAQPWPLTSKPTRPSSRRSVMHSNAADAFIFPTTCQLVTRQP